MTAASHQIQSLVFDIQLSPRDKAHALQNTISRMYTYRLEGLLKQFFEEVIPAGLVIKADNVTLDLGAIPYEQLEGELPERLLKELRKAFDISFTGGDASRLLPAQYTIATTEEGYLQLLLFFMQAGHFPWWAGAITMEQLEDTVELLAVKRSRQLRALLMQEGKKEQVRRRIAWQFSEQAIRTLIQILEPEECFFILAYHKSVTRQQHQYNLVKSGTEDFKRAVWFFIFSFLLSERETWFNRRVFIKSTLRQMAAHFNVPYLSLISMLYQALYAAGVDIEQARLTWFIKVVLEEELPAPARRLAAADAVQETHTYDLADTPVAEWIMDKASQAAGPLYLKNILAYFLQTGAVPGFTDYTPGTMEALLQQLLQQYPQQALLLLKWAGQEEKRKNRFLYQFSPELIAAILLLLPQGGEALAASQLLAQLAERNRATGFLPERNEKRGAAGRLRMLWNHYAETEYLRFHAGSFYVQGLKLLYPLPAQAWYSLLPELGTLFVYGGEAALQAVVTLMAVAEPRESGRSAMPVRQEEWRQAVLQLPEIKKMLLSVSEQELHFLPLFPVFYQPGVDTTTAVADALAYFLLWNRLPDTLPAMERDAEKGLLSDMVLLLFQQDRTRLRSLFLSPLNSYVAKRRIYGLFPPHKGGRETLVAYWLNAFLQADMAVFLGEVPFITGMGYYKELWKGLNLTRAAVLLGKYYGAAVTAPPDEQVLLQQTLQLLDYYFTRDSLPPGLAVQGAEGLLLIQYLFRWALGKSSNSLYSLLQKSGHHATARLQVHQWFATNEYVNGKSVTAFTALWLQHDVMAYLQQTVQQDITETAAWLRLVSWQQLPVAVIKYAAVHFSAATLQKWLQGYSGTWYNRVLPAIEILQRLFRHFTGLTRNWPQLQLNEFILLAFAAHIEVKDAPAFIHRFFAFTDKHIPPPVYRVYEQIARAWAIARETEPAETAVLVRVIDREIALRLLQRPAASIPAATPRNGAATPQEGYPLQEALPAAETFDRVYVQNAGIILLHPFLTVLFSRLAMTEKGKWVSEETQLRAVHLLQHFASGQWEHEEPLLPLTKLLCGVAQEQPVPRQIEPLPEETEMVNAMFQAVFQQWEKMKNSSVEGFRASFLQRGGTLYYKGDQWTLRVEPRGYDLILQTLPWGIGTIRLPWMKEILYVEWEY